MREIIFRGKTLDGERGVEDDLIHCLGVQKGVIDPHTIEPYIGLRDKNGKRIFEGDILRIAKISDGLGSYYHPPLDYPVNVVVKWDLCAWMWETLCEDKRYISFPNAWCHYECEIIGNIHDNPELLEGGNDE